MRSTPILQIALKMPPHNALEASVLRQFFLFGEIRISIPDSHSYATRIWRDFSKDGGWADFLISLGERVLKCVCFAGYVENSGVGREEHWP